MTQADRRVLRGQIQDYRVTRTTEDFFFSEAERKGMGMTAVATSAAGLVGLGVGLLSASGDTYEEADLVEFEVDGEPVQGFLWQSPFGEGDEVEIVAEKVGETWKAFGIARLSDRIVALRPHCSRGSVAHAKKAVTYWLVSGGLVLLITSIMAAIVAVLRGGVGLGDYLSLVLWGGIGAMFVFGLIAWSVARKYKRFVRMAEMVFHRFGWRNVEKIDLPALTKRLRKPDDPVELGATYFRYAEHMR